MALGRRQKTEHAGAKNGGGYWGTRNQAKKICKKIRRELGKKIIREQSFSTIISFKF